MKVKELIEKLALIDPDARVLAWDADSQVFEDVTGLLHGPEPGGGETVTICTDDIS